MPDPPDSPPPAKPAANEGSPRAARPRKSSRLPGFDDLKPRESRSRDDELQYFMVRTNCLVCRRIVQAPVNRLHCNLRCPNCGTRMYVSNDGTFHLGVHPSLQGEAEPQPNPPAGSIKQRRAGTRRWPSFLRQRSGRLLLLLLIIVGGLSAAVISLPARQQSDLPPTLDGRAALVGMALVQNDLDRLWGVADTGTRDDLREWTRLVVERIDKMRNSGGLTSARHRVLFLNSRDRMAAASIEFLKGQEIRFRCTTMWSLNEQGYWMLDGSRTLKDLEISGFSRASDEHEKPSRRR